MDTKAGDIVQQLHDHIAEDRAWHGRIWRLVLIVLALSVLSAGLTITAVFHR